MAICMLTSSYRLDERPENDGDQLQDYLQEKTGQRTVPNVFIRTCAIAYHLLLALLRIYFCVTIVVQKHVGGEQ